MPTIFGEPDLKAKRINSWETPRDLRNVGGNERALRFVMGAAALIATTMAGRSWLRAVLSIAGAMSFLTAVTGYCPANQARGRDSFHRLR